MPNPDPTLNEKKFASVVTVAAALGIVQLYLDKAFVLAERAVRAMERNAEAAEKIAETGVKVSGTITTRPGVR